MPDFDLLILGGTCVTPAGLVTADLGVTGGKIAEVGALKGRAAAQQLDSPRA